MYLNGKGIFIWQIKPILNGDQVAIANAAADAGLTHVLVKVADGLYKYNFYNGQELVPALVNQLRQRGLKVWGWHYVYGAYPAEEANIAAVRIQQLALEGYVINAEKEFKVAAGKTMARSLMQALRAKVSGVPAALSTYRYLSVHPEFPFQAFHPYIDLCMPQVYWQAATNSAPQLRKSYNEYKAGMPGLPIIPTGPCYRVTGWAPTPEQITAFLDEAHLIGLTAANFWHWGGAATRAACYGMRSRPTRGRGQHAHAAAPRPAARRGPWGAHLTPRRTGSRPGILPLPARRYLGQCAHHRARITERISR